MRTYLSNLIPSLKKFSKQLDDVSLLTKNHWVIVDTVSNIKSVYIFRANKELIISHDGKVEKANWDYLGNESLLIEKQNESYLFKHGFFDDNILALKVDNKNEYVFFINENKYDVNLNTFDKLINFLELNYIESSKKANETIVEAKKKRILVPFKTSQGIVEIEQESSVHSPSEGANAYLNGKLAPNGKYKFGFMFYVNIEEGKVKSVSLF
ncbi:hypothetical protein [Flavobacterium caeni]|uniref:Uncharacterized protein n=1 Tax=Flavobacterium caeni TaxID=490189 RepID=A0A1G5KLI5_9FLAO|nr:hypothetical protein [Flavobacterium caeni]SCZ01456.1 hypothetical protein SAMN02927903_03369 [Flavobacterium caeni]